MNSRFFAKVARSNLKKNAKMYIPYLLTCCLSIAMYYVIDSLSINPGIQQMYGGAQMQPLLVLGTFVVALFVMIFLFYTNSFLVKRRKKEFGVFNILGMEKRHIIDVIAFETFYTALLTLISGILAGILFERIIFGCFSLLSQSSITMFFYVSSSSILHTIILFLIIYVLILFNSTRQIHLANPIELLHGSSYGEREPKSKWLLALIGLLCMGSGYGIAVTVKNPLSAFLYFFLAVVLVIAGTYLLFTAGSIVLLKLLKKNKRFYYQTTHFINVSTMIYRMKQNAVGLANICILSTMVLVMLSTTIALYVGMGDAVESRYPRELNITTQNITGLQRKELQEIIGQEVEDLGLQQLKTLDYSYLSFGALEEGEHYLTDLSSSDMANMDKLVNLFFISLDDYNQNSGEQKELSSDEVLLYCNQGTCQNETIDLFDQRFHVVQQLDEFVGNTSMSSLAAKSYFIVVKDSSIIDELYAAQKEQYKEQASEHQHFMAFDTDGTSSQNLLLYERLSDWIRETEGVSYVESRTASYDDFFSLYAGFLFIGIFLSVLFIMAAILILYYKQISEGYEDQNRFSIMQKVGLDHHEVRHVIHSQVLMVFFLPILVAGIHIAFAFPLIRQLLQLLYLANTSLYIVTTLICFIGFALIYCMVYMMTSKVYYGIVKQTVS